MGGREGRRDRGEDEEMEVKGREEVKEREEERNRDRHMQQATNIKSHP